MSRFDRPLALQLLAVVVAALVAALVAGALVGFTVAAAAVGAGPSDVWDELGAVLLGLAAGASAGTVVYAGVVVVGVRHVVPEGRRARAGAALLAGPVFLTLTSGLASEAGGTGLLASLGVVGAVGFLVIAIAAVLAASGALDHARAVRLGCGALAVSAASLALSFLLGPA